MRRTVATLHWEAELWVRRSAQAGPNTDPAFFEGRKAYALRQAGVRMYLANLCNEKWAGVGIKLATGPGGIALADEVFNFVQ